MSARGARARAPGRAGAAGRVAVVLFIAAGIAFLGLLAGGEHRRAGALKGEDPMAGYYPAEMPRYPGAEEVPAGPSSQVGMTKVRMSYFSTEDAPAKVARYYAGAWRERQLFVREDVTHVGGVVSAVDAGKGKVYQVLLAVRDGRTAVFPSVTSSPLAAADTPSEPPPITPFPGSRGELTLGSDEGSSRARIFLSVNDGTLDENLAHHERELRAHGYLPDNRKQPEGTPDGVRVLVFHKEGSEITVNLTALDAKRTRVHLMEVGSSS